MIVLQNRDIQVNILQGHAAIAIYCKCGRTDPLPIYIKGSELADYTAIAEQLEKSGWEAWEKEPMCPSCKREREEELAFEERYGAAVVANDAANMTEYHRAA